MTTVWSYDTDDRLGEGTQELAEASFEAPSGAVLAYQDEAGVWQYVPPERESFYREKRREAVTTVYVDDQHNHLFG